MTDDRTIFLVQTALLLLGFLLGWIAGRRPRADRPRTDAVIVRAADEAPAMMWRTPRSFRHHGGNWLCMLPTGHGGECSPVALVEAPRP
jgi:hypothetical protein